MGVDCEIKFDENPDGVPGVFYAGQSLSGVVEIDVKEKFKIKKLSLAIDGVAKVQWTEFGEKKDKDTQKDPKTRLITYSGKQKYLSSHSNLIENETELGLGIHTYNFKVDLPAELPSSIAEDKGYIVYKISVTFERSWKFNYVQWINFKVIQPYDLNLDHSLKVPAQQDVSRTFLKGFMETKPLRAILTMPVQGFIVNQPAKILVDIDNPTLFDVKEFRLTLLRTVTYNSETPYEKTKTVEKRIQKVTTGQTFSKGTHKYEINFNIPDVVPTITSKSCSILNISYDLKVKLKLLKGLDDLEVKFPITIGTIALRENSSRNGYDATPIKVLPTTPPYFPSPPSVPSAPMFPADNPPPPFNEAIRMRSAPYPMPQPYSNNVDGPIGFVMTP